MSKFLKISMVALVTLTMVQQAQAKGLVCQQVQAGMFRIDGMEADWEDVAVSTSYGVGGVGGAGEDGVVGLRCAYDDEKLYIFLEAVDDKLIRTKRGIVRQEDHLSVSLAVGNSKALTFRVLPGAPGVARKVLGAPSDLALELEDSLQERGVSVEFSVPLEKIPGWSRSVPYLSARILYYDVDRAHSSRPPTGLRGKMHFSEAASTYRAFMKTVGLHNRDIRLDVLADVDPGDGAERILVGAKVLGVLGKSYTYVELPIASARDLLSAKVVDFDGSGRSLVLTQLRQFGNGGSRDVVMLWEVGSGGSFAPVITVETRKQQGDAYLENTWKLVPRGKYRQPVGGRGKHRQSRQGAGHDLLVQTGKVVGFDSSSFRQAPATDAKSILVPWAGAQSAVYFFEGTVAYGGEEANPKPRK